MTPYSRNPLPGYDLLQNEITKNANVGAFKAIVNVIKVIWQKNLTEWSLPGR